VSIGDGVPAQVVSCDQDSYGYIVEVAVEQPTWFPLAYTPPHVIWPS
jgi:hypothetical protein